MLEIMLRIIGGQGKIISIYFGLKHMNRLVSVFMYKRSVLFPPQMVGIFFLYPMCTAFHSLHAQPIVFSGFAT